MCGQTGQGLFFIQSYISLSIVHNKTIDPRQPLGPAAALSSFS